jgi:hypothetical protein
MLLLYRGAALDLTPHQADLFAAGMKIYLLKDGQILGPFGEQEVRSQIKSGAISRDDLIAVEGDEDWKPVSESPLARPPVSPPPLHPPTTPFPPFVAAAPVAPVTPSWPPVQTQTFVRSPGTSSLAIASLILGVFGVFCLLPSLPAILTGHMALFRIRRTPGLQGHGLAVSGLILGYGVILVALAIAALVVSFSTDGFHSIRNWTR